MLSPITTHHKKWISFPNLEMAIAPSSSFSALPSLSFISNLHSSHNLSFNLQNPFLKSLNGTPFSSRNNRFRFSTSNSLQSDQYDNPLLQKNEEIEVDESVKVLKNAAKSRKVPAKEVLSALDVMKKAKIDPSPFLSTLGGTHSPGRTWMLIFTAKARLESGSYFPITAVQRFDAAAKRIENGVYLGPLGSLTFEGPFSWKKKILAFVFERLRIKLGPFNPLEISLGKRELGSEPSSKDPFFIWFYVDEEIAVAQGRGGGTAFWCRCCRAP